MSLQVAFFEEKQLFATSSLGPGLRHEFGEQAEHNVHVIRPGDLRPSLLRNIDVLVLPGITGEKSPYPRVLPPEKAQLIYDKMEQDGLAVYAECAALYWANQEISYLRSDGKQLRKQGLGWIDGIARNVRRGIATDRSFRYADTTTADISYKVDSQSFYTSICISNGPAIYLSDDEKSNPDLEITSRFIHLDGQPAASVAKKIGNGLLIGMGVLPHIKPAQLVGRYPDPAQENHRSALFNKLAANESGITHFEKMIFNKIRAHHEVLHAQPT